MHAMGETRVDLVHLLEDLRDAYPGSLEETILTEIVANALDSGATRLDFWIGAEEASVVAIDDGTGMTKRELGRYHDLATTSKRRGRGIGFAGVGIKLGLLACEEVVTETLRGGVRAATRWRLSNRSRAPWSWIEPPMHLEESGTAIELRLSNALSHLLDAAFLEAVVLRNFQPLFEPEFLDVLTPFYRSGLTVRIDGRVVVGPIRTSERVPVELRIGRQRKSSAVGYLARHGDALPESERGLAISTLGKVIRRGWDWIGLTPADGDRVEGLIEVPALAEALTLNKGDFLRTGQRGALFLAYRKAIQEAVSAQLAVWGETPTSRRQARTRPMERDLDRVLGELASDFPLLATLTERRSGGQRRLALGGAEFGGDSPFGPGEFLRSASLPAPTEDPGSGIAGGDGTSKGDVPRGPPASRGDTAPAPGADTDASAGAGSTQLPGRARRRKKVKLSLEIRFESRPGDERLGRLIESTVWVNDAHPAYRRASSTRSEGYHIALTVATALAPLTVEPARAQEFINRFLARWGEAGMPGRRG
jgi:hypothetical protein